MSGQYIVIIVFAAIWVLALLITGYLAYKYKLKHDLFVKERTEYDIEFQKLVENTNVEELMKPINTNISLPENEFFFQIDHNVNVYVNSSKQINTKSKRKLARYDTKQEYREYYGIMSLKDVYGIGRAKNKLALPTIKGDMFVTNERIIFKEEKEFEEIMIDDINKCYAGMVYLDKDFYRGFLILTKNTTYQIVTNKPETVIIINELLNERKEEENVQ